MIEPFGWDKWNQVYLHKKNKKRASLERYGLRNLHSVASLDFIVSKVHETYSKKSENVSVNAKSVWVDGTPQAKFMTGDGLTLNCELADLLLIVHEIDESNTTKNFRGVLLQAKCSERHNILPNGLSTDKERKLLESIDRNQPLTLYPGTRAYGQKIGEYILGGSSFGLSDCTKYLMMPKYEKWNYKTSFDVSPYVTGWPQTISSKNLIDTVNYLDSIISGMIFSKSMGKEIKLANCNSIDIHCAWSKMIYDLLNCYLPITMKGYGCQRRVYKSSLSGGTRLGQLTLIQDEYFDSINRHGVSELLNGKDRFLYQTTLNMMCDFTGPVISTIFIEIKKSEEGKLIT